MSEKLTRSDERLPGKLDQEQLDALKMEVSVLSPEEDAELRVEAESANATFQQLYGKYCRSEPNSEELSRRIILTDHDSMGRFNPAWFPEVSKFISYTNSADMTAFGDEQGEFVLGEPIDVWTQVTENIKDQLVSQYGSEENAKEFLNGVVRYNLLAHELSHLYQDADLPMAFRECGAYYYGREIAKHDRGSFDNFGDKLIDMRTDFYTTLLAVYGEDVHRLSFGTLEDTAKKQKILNLFGPNVIRQLFPEMPEEKG